MPCDVLDSRSGGVLLLVDNNGAILKDKDRHPFAFGFLTKAGGSMDGLLKSDEPVLDINSLTAECL